MTASTTPSNLFVTSSSGEQVEVPDEFICPITLQVMVHPLTTRSGKNFERAAILSWLGEGTGQCPLSRQPLRPSDLIPNRFLEAKIAKWREDDGIPEPSEEELQENKCDFVGFLRVSEKDQQKFKSSAIHRPQITLNSAVVESIMASAPTSSQTSRSSRMSGPFARRRGERRRSFLSRILNSAMDELDE